MSKQIFSINLLQDAKIGSNASSIEKWLKKTLSDKVGQCVELEIIMFGGSPKTNVVLFKVYFNNKENISINDVRDCLTGCTESVIVGEIIKYPNYPENFRCYF